MSKLAKLSFNLDPGDPLLPAIPPVEIDRLLDVAKEDKANGYSQGWPLGQGLNYIRATVKEWKP